MAIHAALSPALCDDDARAFDAFLRDGPFAAYQQSRAWAAVAPAHSRRAWCFFRAFDGEELVGAGVIRSTRLAMGYLLASLHRGPVVHDPDRLEPVLRALCRALRAERYCSVQLAPRVRGRMLPAMAEALRAAGFAPLPPARRPLHNVTGIVWLDKPEEEVLAGFKQRARRAIRQAEKAGIAVRAVTGAEDIARFQRVLGAFAAARPDYDMSGQPDAIGQARLIDALGGAMLLAERDGEAIGAHAFVRQADEAIWLSLATVERGGGASPSYPLLWEGMRRARAAGAVGYDLAGLADEASDDAGEAGRNQFKTAFAPLRRVMPPVQMAALAPVPHTLLYGAREAYRRWRPARAAHG
jgi:lipid II:glycine glycyltransferase (peptidoglycan interpeptide bridge formation enzyme)